jgi:hypothetical protein
MMLMLFCLSLVGEVCLGKEPTNSPHPPASWSCLQRDYGIIGEVLVDFNPMVPVGIVET